MSIQSTPAVSRRKLRFESYDDILNDVRKLAGGRCHQLGNWSLGQACQHLANTMHMSIDGATGKAPWFLRLIGPLVKSRILTRPMRPGFKVPPGISAQLLPGDKDSAAGVAELEKAIERLKQTADRKPHVVFGPLSRDEWDSLHMRHSELHLSFLVPQSA
jgi:hypothetical protein